MALEIGDCKVLRRVSGAMLNPIIEAPEKVDLLIMNGHGSFLPARRSTLYVLPATPYVYIANGDWAEDEGEGVAMFG